MNILFLLVVALSGCVSIPEHKRALREAKLDSYADGVVHGVTISAEQISNTQLSREEILANMKWFLELKR